MRVSSGAAALGADAGTAALLLATALVGTVTGGKVLNGGRVLAAGVLKEPRRELKSSALVLVAVEFAILRMVLLGSALPLPALPERTYTSPLSSACSSLANSESLRILLPPPAPVFIAVSSGIISAVLLLPASLAISGGMEISSSSGLPDIRLEILAQKALHRMISPSICRCPRRRAKSVSFCRIERMGLWS
jgi:hypothetical protein